jgi:beta-glucanase (GH16 family)
MAQSPQGQRQDARTGGLPTVWALIPTFLVIVIAVYSLAAITRSRPVTDEVAATAVPSTATSTGSGATSTTLGNGAPFSLATPTMGSGATNTTLDFGASTASSTPSATSSGIAKANAQQASTPAATAATPTTTAPPTTTTTTPPSSTTTTAPVSTIPAPATGMSLAFTAGFAGSSLNSSVWDTCYEWYVAAVGCTNYGNTQETEWYLPAQDQVSDGALHLVATETPTQGTDVNGAPKTYPYASGMVTTFSSFNFTYGYVQVVARIPGGTGTWPALWLLPQNGSWPPEIDIMENYGTSNLMEATLHWGSASGGEAYRDVTSSSDLTSGWHTYGLLWEPGSLTWYLDGQVVYTFTGSEVPSQPMYFLANLAIDGPAAPSSSFDIQSVQIYQPA